MITPGSISFKLSKGLDIPLTGKPEATIEASGVVRRVALLGRDYPGVKPAFLVQEGERVALGQPLFCDKKERLIQFTAPAAGRVSAINRGERRSFISIEIETDGEDELTFPPLSSAASASEIEERLMASGLWSAFRTRPFGKIPTAGSRPAAIFVTAIDSNPLAAEPSVIISRTADLFQDGLQCIRSLTSGKVYLCCANAEIPSGEGITRATFSGPHPAGLPGTHINFLEPVDLQRQVWHIGYQDVSAIGFLARHGRLMTERLVALAGPGVMAPKLISTRLGAHLDDLVEGKLASGDQRIISGSVLSGHKASGAEAFLGRYHNQVSVLPEGGKRHFLEWLLPGFNRHSVKRLFAASIYANPEILFSTSANGSPRALVPVGAYEKVMPLDIQITWLLRSLLAQDAELAMKLGCLELEEDDLALCSYVCPGKSDYGSHLRLMLERIEAEGA